MVVALDLTWLSKDKQVVIVHQGATLVLNVVRKGTSHETAQVKVVEIVNQEVMHALSVGKKGISHETAQAKAVVPQGATLVLNVVRKDTSQETAQALHLLSEVEVGEAVEEAAIGQALKMNRQAMAARVSLQGEDGQIKKVLTLGTIKLNQSKLPLNGASQKQLMLPRNGEKMPNQNSRLMTGTIRYRLPQNLNGEN